MYSKALLAQLQAERRKPQQTLALTPDGSVTQEVHQALDAERERAIAAQQAGLSQALVQLRHSRAQAFSEGLACAHFNHTTEEMTP